MTLRRRRAGGHAEPRPAADRIRAHHPDWNCNNERTGCVGGADRPWIAWCRAGRTGELYGRLFIQVLPPYQGSKQS